MLEKTSACQMSRVEKSGEEGRNNDAVQVHEAQLIIEIMEEGRKRKPFQLPAKLTGFIYFR